MSGNHMLGTCTRVPVPAQQVRRLSAEERDHNMTQPRLFALFVTNTTDAAALLLWLYQ